jgi:hypothetical protein
MFVFVVPPVLVEGAKLCELLHPLQLSVHALKGTLASKRSSREEKHHSLLSRMSGETPPTRRRETPHVWRGPSD